MAHLWGICLSLSELVGSRVYEMGTVFWKESSIYYITRENGQWIHMRGTGQIEVKGGGEVGSSI